MSEEKKIPKMHCIVRSTLLYNGKVYGIGETVEISKDDFSRMFVGTVEPVDTMSENPIAVSIEDFTHAVDLIKDLRAQLEESNQTISELAKLNGDLKGRYAELEQTNKELQTKLQAAEKALAEKKKKQ